MVIASALPIPHSPASGVTAGTAQSGSYSSRKHRLDPAAHLIATSVDLRGHAPHVDYRTTTDPRLKSSFNQETSTFRTEDQISHHVPANEGTLGTEDLSKDSLPKDFSTQLDLQDSTETLSQVSTEEKHDIVSPPTILKGHKGPDPTAASEQLRDAPTVRTGSQQTPRSEEGPPEDTLTMDAGLDERVEHFLEGDEMFLDAHPRVLFSPSPSPPGHPPLLLMLETSLLEDGGDGGDRDDQEDTDGHIEGHGDRAIDRSSTPSWVNYSKLTAGEAARPVRRDKRSHLVDRRRGEKSVCEAESDWVNKTSAIDSHGKKVTIIQEIQTRTGPLKQYFYETRCRRAEQRGGRAGGVTGVAGAGCLGVDKKQWRSECKARQSYVRALTKDVNNRTGWRWIRIDSSCVCVLLSRTNQGREGFTKRGWG